MRIEEEHQDVLQNIELTVATLYKSHPEMTDHAVLRTYEALVDVYASEFSGRPPRLIPPPGLEADLFQDAHQVCQWRLGRTKLKTSEGEGIVPEPIDVQTLINCLKRLITSVKKWNKRGGRQGYLSFMTQFVN
jgi:hypothetical protein